MKQTKWQRLATIGLCSSLVINAFSGVTAVAETITIESSPTVASSAKEATSASSATPESTESSQETTETSREEVTQETVEQEDTTEIAQEENLLEPSGIQAKIMPRAFVWAATGTTNRTTVRLNDVVDYRMKLENITTDDTNSDIVGPIRIESKLAAGMTRPTSVIIKVGPEEQNVVIGEGSHNANSGGEYFVWTESTRTVTAFINRLHGRTSGNTGYIKTLYFQTRITSGTHNEKKYIDSTIRFNGFGAVNRRNEMTYVDRFSGNLGLKGNLKFYDEDGVASKEQMSLSINPVLFKSTNSRVEGTLLRYPLTMTNAGSGLYRFDTGLKNIGTSNGGSWFFFSNDIAINFATATTNRIDKIVLAPPKATLPDSRTGVMTSRAYTSTTYTRSNYDISTYNFTKATGKTWRITNRSSNSGVSTNIMFSDNLVGTTGQFNKGNSGATINYYIYYKKLYENFVNSNGQKITPPSGFTQGKRTVINSEAYTFKQSGTLPDTYQADGKTYKFKGWYKGKTKPNTLTTTKAPSYAVTYNNDDDLTVVYEEIEFFDFPALTYQFGFVDESGKRVDASTIGLTYDKWRGELLTNNVNDWKTVSLEKGQVAPTKNNLKEIAYPAQSLEILSDRSTQYSAANLTFTLPKYYGKISVYNKSGTFDAGYLFPNIQNNNSSEPSVEGLHKNLSSWFELKKSGNQSFVFNKPIPAAPIDVQVPAYLREIVYNPDLISNTAVYYVIDKPVYYYLTNRKVTENFVDTSGAKITPPTGFTQGKQTAITSDPYTFKQAGTLPDTYTTGGKTYKFKGWYKGKTKTEPLTTTKAPSYGVTYNDNDDLNVVYEEVTAIYPGFYAQFVDEQGKAFTNPLTLSGNYTEFLRKTGTTVFETKGAFYPMVGKRDTTVTNKYKIETTSSLAVPNNYWTAMSADIANRGYALNNLDITNQMKYVDKIETTDTHTTMYDYTGVSDIWGKPNNTSQTELNPIDKTFVKQTDNTFAIKSIWGNGTFSHIVPKMLLLAESGSFSRLFGFDGTPDYKQTVNYKVTRKQVTETFVNTNGTKITPPTGFTQGKQTVIDSDPYTFKQSGTLPDTYTTGGKTYKFKGWYKGKTKPNTLTATKAPSYAVTYDDNDDLNVVYEEIEAFDFPALTYQFGFVGEDGKLANPADINITYDYKTSAYRGTGGGADDTVSFGTIATNQSATTVGNLKNVTMPATSIARPTETGYNGDAYANFSIKLPRYYQSLNL